MDIVKYIPTGKENAIHLGRLETQTGLPADTIKKQIQKARENGFPILSGTHGYWISTNREEQAAYISMMRDQALTRLKTVQALSSSLKLGDNQQMDIFDYLGA